MAHRLSAAHAPLRGIAALAVLGRRGPSGLVGLGLVGLVGLVGLPGLGAAELGAQENGAPAPSATPSIPTRVVVRAVAQDAKVVGSGVGGAWIQIREAVSGRVLAEGLQEGGTGDTGRIMGARERGATVFDTPGAGVFQAEIPLAAPTRVEVTARGPLGAEHAAQTASASLLLIPGEHVEGEGVILTLHGFTVELLEPLTEPFVAAPGASVPIRARVTLLCGCPTEPGGRWDAHRITLRGQWVREGRVVDQVPLTFTGTTSEYQATLRAPAAVGPVTLRIIAVDAERANAGMAEALGRIR